MWNGRIVPLVDGIIPIPSELRTGMGLRTGTRLIASTYSLTDGNNSGTSAGSVNDGLLGGILLTLVRKQVLSRSVTFTFDLANWAGAMQLVTDKIADSSGQILLMEGIGTGHFKAHIFFPDQDQLVTCIEELAQLQRDQEPTLQAFHVTPPAICNEDTDLLKRILTAVQGDASVAPGGFGPYFDPLTTRLNPTDTLGIPDRPFEHAHRKVRHRAGWLTSALQGAIDHKGFVRNETTSPDAYVASLRVNQYGIPLPEALLDSLRAAATREATPVGTLLSGHGFPMRTPSHVLLAGDPDEMAITCLIPSRPLIEVVLECRSFSPRDPHPCVGVIARASRILKDRKLNVLHTQVFNVESHFADTLKTNMKEADSDKLGARYDDLTIEPLFEKGEARFIAALPHSWVHKLEADLECDLDTLAELFAQPAVKRGDQKALKNLLAKLSSDFEFGLANALDRFPDNFSGSNATDKRSRRRLSDSEIRAIRRFQDLFRRIEAKSFSEQVEALRHAIWCAQLFGTDRKKLPKPMREFRKMLQKSLRDARETVTRCLAEPMQLIDNVEIHASPFMRVFLASSENPEPNEARFIEKVRGMLKKLGCSIVEGRWTHGDSIDKATRRRINQCDTVVTVLWDRSTNQGRASEWIVHEESYGMGRGKGIFRFRESSVAQPSYQRDSDEFCFDSQDSLSWGEAINRCRIKIREYLFRCAIGHRGTDRPLY